MLEDAVDWYKQRFTLRLFAIMVIVPLVLFVWGAGEVWRCTRSIFGPSTIAYSEVTEKGLRGYGYVRVTGVRYDTERVSVVMNQSGGVESMYARVLPADPSTVRGRGTVLAWWPGSGGIPEGVDLRTADEVVGWVDYPLSNHSDGQRRELLRGVSGGIVDECWVVSMQGPSWLKGLGLAGGAVVFVGLVGLYLMKKPLNP